MADDEGKKLPPEPVPESEPVKKRKRKSFSSRRGMKKLSRLKEKFRRSPVKEEKN